MSVNTPGFLQRKTWFAAVVVLCYACISIAVSLGWQHQTWSQLSGGSWEASSAAHWLGTNQVGQDIFARAVVSTQASFSIGLKVMLGALIIATILGASAGLARGTWWDRGVMWIAAVVDAIPFYLLALAVAYAFQHSAQAVSAALISALWTTTARLVRAEVMRLREQDFVAAARMLGVSQRLIMWRHLLPNLSPMLLIQAVLLFVTAVKAEVVLSFIGLGVSNQISWGVMLAESTQEVLLGQWNNFLTASLLLSILVLALNILADSLQYYWDPRQHQVRAELEPSGKSRTEAEPVRSFKDLA